MARKSRPPKEQSSPTGWRITDATRKEFTDWCDLYGRGYEKELAKALFLWTHESSLIREWVERAIAGDPEFGPEFWQVFEEQCDAAARELKRRHRDKIAGRLNPS